MMINRIVIILLFSCVSSVCYGQHSFHTVEMQCISMNAYFEARNEPVLAHQAILEVVLTRKRLKGFPNRVCSVIWQNNQFSWTITKTLNDIKEREVYSALEVVMSVLVARLHQLPNVTQGATHYHHKSVSPCWLPDMLYITTIGSHRFYKQVKRSGACLKKKQKKKTLPSNIMIVKQTNASVNF